MKVNSVYIHIPFCLRKCNYCDFVSFPADDCRQRLSEYSGLLQKELELYQKKICLDSMHTIYFGGGTPSLMEPSQIAGLISLFPPAEEVTLEANPETLDEERLAAFRQAGINRLSMGVQSFDEKLLQSMGRGHSPAQAIEMVAAARKAGFDNISIDLIYGLPGQTADGWRQDLEQALALETEHISLYGLTIEPGTPWGSMVQKGQLAPVDEDLAADMLEIAMDRLEQAGFNHYEISNFARPGYESRHNLAYWRRENYLGLGVAAAGCLLEHRLYNYKDYEDYEQAVSEGRLPLMDEEILHIDQVIGEAIFLGLRLSEGIDFAAFQTQYGLDPRRRFRRAIGKMSAAGLLQVDNEGMRLTKRGVLLGNQVFEQFV